MNGDNWNKMMKCALIFWLSFKRSLNLVAWANLDSVTIERGLQTLSKARAWTYATIFDMTEFYKERFWKSNSLLKRSTVTKCKKIKNYL